ncbi:hypothetical protein N0V93_002167 [Gnomoniopsis smithogilvyi]|uniref:Rhodopsin domain-containing protein n=1 Tax=Gnomoniopsis smithogilvyi TaxID=1191159 RepID=A0A9W8YW46_9PEZI|nr:hypothetical protein N0V93_002167 [Gnomoniopsis smithogilvyi]
MVSTTMSDDELRALAAIQTPIQPKGPALAFIIVSAISYVLALIAIILRVYARAFRKKTGRSIWGWDDTFAVLGMIAYSFVFAFSIFAATYGLGTPDDELSQPLALRGLQYNTWWEVSYCISISFTRTSIGIAVHRIAVQRSHRLACWGLILVSNLTYLVGMIWALSHCNGKDALRDALSGTCTGDSIIMPLSYIVLITAALCDAGFVVVPFLVVRNLQMRPRLKYTLMAVMAMGSLAAVFSTARLPWVPYMPVKYGTLYEGVFMCILSMVENMIGLVFGSLPAIGKMLRLYDRTNKTPAVKPFERLGDYSFGGTPFTPLGGSTELNQLRLVPSGQGESRTRIWSEFNTVATTLLDAVEEESLPKSPGRIEKQFSFAVEELRERGSR